MYCHKIPYITKSKHYIYPVGTKCLASTEDCGRVIVLEFEDGGIIKLPTVIWGLQSLFSNNKPRTINQIYSKIRENFGKSIDRDIINELNKSVNYG